MVDRDVFGLQEVVNCFTFVRFELMEDVARFQLEFADNSSDPF